MTLFCECVKLLFIHIMLSNDCSFHWYWYIDGDMLSACRAYYGKCVKITYVYLLDAVVDFTHEIESDIHVVWSEIGNFVRENRVK